MATPSRRSSRKSSAAANRSIRGQSEAAPSRTPSKAKKIAPKDEIIGKRISAYWPRDRKYYECRVIDYNTENGQHKVCYDEDDSVEMINLTRRRFKELSPTDEEKKPGSLIGKKIEVVVDNISSPDGPTDDFRAFVLRPAPPEKDVDEDEDDEDEVNEELGTYQVLFLAKDFIATVDLKNLKYTILDMITNEPVKEVNGTDAGDKADEDEVAKTDKEEVEDSKGDKEEDENKSVGATEAETKESSKPILDVVLERDDPPSAVEEAEAKETKKEKDSSGGDAAMKDVAEETNEEKPEIEKEGDGAEAEPTKGSTLEKPEELRAAPTRSLMEVDSVNKSEKPETEVSGTTASLTKDNLDKLEEGNFVNTANGTSVINGKAIVDEDTKTVSDGENDNWVVGSSERIAEPKKWEKKFIMHKLDAATERVAYVESYLSSGNHFVVYHDEQGGQSQLVLTKENCRELTKEEIEKLEGKEPNQHQPTPLKVSKRKATPNGKETSNKRQRTSTSSKVGPALPPPGMEIVGKCVTVTWPNNGKRYKCLVIGCQVDAQKTMHKVYYLEDDTTETMDLTSRNWSYGDSGKLPWNSEGLVGKRLYVFWDGEYADEDVQKKAIEKFGTNQTKIAYEAFVVKFLGPHKYRLLYTVDDNLEDRTLQDDGDDWNICDEGMADVDGLPIIAWTGPADDEEF